MIRFAPIYLSMLFISGCAVLKPVEVKRFGNTSAYQFVFISQTQTLNSSAGGGYIGYGTSGGFSYMTSKSINPSDVISGILMKKGFVIVESITNPTQTLIVKYGQGDKREVLGGLGGYTLEVSIQILKAKTQEPLFLCTAEGQGDTEADDIREAITRCLQEL
ncbi:MULTISPECIES: hypothetical protein [Helicobacter]|uniref:DUF4136 domain-containing protein n=2 Tax=Helicobacter typhlonius TaxID=76936 RepID=A0A099UGY2_9HELI|nr:MULTISPECIES: hypothetical protein [Helicobacter]MDE6886321.1 DUF4136 domain-containing protein [Helicobacteraceae bacterium]TLD78328.1 DUF4136 domain-containing protein [Helicobacter typhlonius]CUU38903.1 Hypothetical protein BN2458_PEG0016 [Helicobacter typhlonius]